MDSTSESGAADDGAHDGQLPDSDTRNKRRGFTPEVLDSTAIAIPLLRIIRKELKRSAAARAAGTNYVPPLLDVMIDLNLEHEHGRDKAADLLRTLIPRAIESAGQDKGRQGIDAVSPMNSQYVVAQLEPAVISALVQLDRQPATGESVQANRRSIFRIWPDFEINKLTNKSVSTVKADAARVSFSAFGENIVWAVVDSGIDEKHPHFEKYHNLRLKLPLRHRDFTDSGNPLSDEFGHGTHVAGIIAGAMAEGQKIYAMAKRRDEHGETAYDPTEITAISGMAPKCKLLSLKVLDDKGQGRVSRVIAALEEIQQVNGYGRNIQIHGVNLSVGYEFQPEWFACGQSPLCIEVDLLVRSGVVVVVAAGNTGYGYNRDKFKGMVAAGLDLTINDPGNAERAITVGSTHRESPHVYGVSYFSSKGPTGDGRLKPDLVAPGEKIMSCAAGASKEKAKRAAQVKQCDYVEDSGTSMAAPHVSGVIAAFLSVRREYIGKTDEVKEIFVSSATDLKRDRNFQGHGIVDLMRAIQSV
ncbi:S8 family peptidase [Paenarthrobacter sp. Z7-10]|uniref:S8 family peptidase n=1 Tax=Paenarthrobacter sp. Z7-10 TaxID=2787635 RepID=UPI0022A9CC77|nr:S8 family peptidase [Paenarthrobacter sp. Z7-10]MCZ2404611.1 S8 family peptidase [Paenarthrobacter sp. Z7-10]